MGTIILRIAALVIDLTIIGIINFPLKSIPIIDFNVYSQSFFVTFNYAMIIFIIYYLLFDMLFKGQSVGKMLLHIKVIDPRIGCHPDLKKRIIRTCLKFLSFSFSLITIVVYLIKGKVLHDYFYNLQTVNSKYQNSPKN